MGNLVIDLNQAPDRETLIALREWFEDFAGIPGTNPAWVRAYLDAADAIDHLDAMLARCTITIQKEIKIETVFLEKKLETESK